MANILDSINFMNNQHEKPTFESSSNPETELFSEELINEIEEHRLEMINELERRKSEGSSVISSQSYQERIEYYQNMSLVNLWDKIRNNFPNRLPGGFDRIDNIVKYLTPETKAEVEKLYEDIDRLISEFDYSFDNIEQMNKNYRNLSVAENAERDKIIIKLFLELRKLGYSRHEIGG